MSDIVDRLRKGPAPIDDPDLNDDAADTIEAQAEHIRVLREALTGLLDLFHEGQVTARDEASGYVQAAVSAGERTLEATK